MATKKIYTCPYCNENYETPGDFARCILTCEEKKKLEEEAAKKAAAKAEKEARYNEVVDAYENFEKLRGKYVADYGSFTFKLSKNDHSLDDIVSTLMGMF